MSVSIQVLDAMWNKYCTEFNRIPRSHHQFMAYAKASGTIIKFLDARQYFEMRSNEPQNTLKTSTKRSSKSARKSKNGESKTSDKFRRSKRKSGKGKTAKRRRSSLPEMATPITPSTKFYTFGNGVPQEKEKKKKSKKK
eukprot:250585_1